MPNTIPMVVFFDNFSLPKPKFKSNTQSGDSVEINDANPLEINFSAKVVNPFARTIIIIDSTKALNNWVAVIIFILRTNIRYSKIKLPESKLRIPATKKGGMVSTAILMPKKVVPQKKATQNTEK